MNPHMPHIRHIVTIFLVLSLCGYAGAQKHDILAAPTSSVDNTEYLEETAFFAEKQHYLDSLSVVFSGRNLQVFNDALWGSIPNIAADSTGSSMRAALSSMQGNTMQTAVNIGTFSTGIDYVAVVPLYGFSDNYGSSWPDFFFRFTLTESMSVTLNHEASEIDTRMSLLDSNGTCIAYNDDYDGEGHCTDTRHAFIQQSLPAGTYYIVSEGEYEGAMICLSVYGNASGTFGYSSIPSTYSTYSTSSRVIGTMGTQAGVSAMGGASCSVPIKVPQGVGGLEPSLSITYNSQSGNGLAGYGASLTGMSAITRGPKDIYHDGEARGITYTADDALYLDGVRLVLESGTPGQDGAVYSPESDPFSKVIAHGTCTNTANSTWYEVRSSDGMVYHYGQSQDSRLSYTDSHGAQKIHSWYLCHVQQPSGNYMTYYYHTYSHCVYPYMISYGTNIGQTSTLANIVEFTYENRNDAVPIRFDGVSGSMDRRLKNISCSTNGSIYRTYTLSYNSTSDGSAYKHSRLTGVTEKNGSNQSLPSTQFRWSYLPAVSYQSTAPLLSTMARQNVIADPDYSVCDLNGDGIDDIIAYGKSATASDHQLYICKYLSHKDNAGNVSFTDTVYQAIPTSHTEISGDYPDTYYLSLNASIIGKSSSLDFNGDGKNEFLLAHRFSSLSNDVSTTQVIEHNMEFLMLHEDYQPPMYCRTMLSANCTPLYAFGDIDNDGRTDIVVLETSFYSQRTARFHVLSSSISESDYTYDWTGLPISNSLDYDIYLRNNPRQLLLSDFNGNGLVDILVLYDNGYDIIWNQGGTINRTNRLFQNNNTNSDTYHCYGTDLSNCSLFTAGDFNGDGLMDFLTNTDGTSDWYFHLGNGNGLFTRLTACTLNLTEQDFTDRDNDKFHCEVLDFDSDGLSDVIITKAHYNRRSDFFGLNVWGEFNKTHTYWMRSTGDGLEQVYHATSNHDDDALACRFITGDFNGDGRMELVNYGYDCVSGVNANTDPQWRLYRNNRLTSQSGKVVSVTGDMGCATSFTYTNLTDSSVYTRGTQHSYPAPSYTLPISVVSSMTQDYGESSVYTTDYQYEGLRLHLQGRGLLGFGSMTEHNTTTGITTESGVNHWNGTYYVPESTFTRATVSGQTSQSVTTLGIAGKNVNGRKRYFIYRNRTVETDMDEMSVTTSRTCNTQYGYILSDSTIYSPGMYSVVSYSDHVLAGGAYRPQCITTTQKHTDDAQPFSTTALYTYDSASGAVLQQTDNSQSSKPLTTTYTYDVWGNLTSQVSAGSGITTPLTTHYGYDITHRFLAREYTEPSSSVKLYTYDLWGNILTERDSINASADHATQYTYDSWGNLISTQIPGSGEVSYARGWGSDASRLYYILEQGTARPWTKTWYDSQGREVLRESVGPMDTRICTTTEYNSRSEVLSTTTVQGDLSSTISYTYDSRGRLTSKSAPGNNVVTYNYSSTPDSRTVTVNDNGRSSTTVYDAMGNVKTVTGPVSSLRNTYHSSGSVRTAVTGGSTWTFSYDDRGNRSTMSDPDAGTTTYTYDALGRETRRVDGRGVAYVTSYDYLGRITQKKAGNETIRYTYWTTGPGQLLLKSESLNGWTRNYTYDDLGRVTQESMTKTGQPSRTRTYLYGPSGLMTERTLPGGISQEYSYDSYGNLSGTDFDSGTITWSLASHNGRRTVTETRLNGYSSQPFLSTSLLDSYGYLDSLTVKRGGGYYQQEDYSFSPQTGNLMSRNNGRISEQSFQYDSADRLTRVRQGGQTVLNMSYAQNGNLTFKTGMGTYSYNSSAKPHAVTAVDNTSGEIDYNTQDISYNNWNRVSTVWQYDDHDFYYYGIEYGPDLKRVTSELHKTYHKEQEKFYWDDYEEKIAGSDTLRYYYIYASGELEGLHIVKSSPSGVSSHTTKVLTDHLGSITALIGNEGWEYDALYDAWGKRTIYTPYWFDPAFERGYTGHEHIDELGLINMNGRMYDSRLGRFLSPDPFVQVPTDPQNYNRYSYCLNNPLKYTDPSGEIFVIDDVLVGIAIGAAIGGTINLVSNWNSCEGFGQFAAAFGAGAVSGALTAATAGSAAWVGIGAAAIGGALTSSTNNLIQQTGKNFSGEIDWGQVGRYGLAGLVSGGFSYGGSALFASGSNCVILNGYHIKNKVVSSAICGMIGGAVGGSASGYAYGYIVGGKEFAAKSALSGAIFGVALGGAFGAAEGYATSNIPSNLIPDDGGTYSVYVGSELSSGEVKYVGITSRNPEIRWSEHLKSNTPRNQLDYNVIKGATNLSKQNARIWEQNLINQYGKENLYNKINSIAPKNWNQFNIKP